MISVVRFDPEEIRGGEWCKDKLTAVCNDFRAGGCLWIKEVFSTSSLNDLCIEFINSHQRYLDSQSEFYSQSLRVGDKRLMIPVEVQGRFNDPSLYAHPLICAFMQQVLGTDFKLGSFGAVVSLPGAMDQRIHRDHPTLFGTMIDDFLPSFAVTMIVPLVDLNESNGTTRMWRGSHLERYHVTNSKTEFKDLEYDDPFAAVGDCLLMDYKLYHAGLANASERLRPILYINYFRPWFRDYVNYSKHLPLIVSASELEKIPSQHRPLFANANR